VHTGDFDYELPRDAIAQRPISPRDAARLLVCPSLIDRSFAELPGLLDEGDLVVVNTTRVRAARLRGHKEGTGGAVEALLLRRDDDGTWEALVRPARRLKVGTSLRLGSLRGDVLETPENGRTRLRLDGPDVEVVIANEGEIPLPPYIDGPVDPAAYQTVFADEVGSAAAPTAGLHFTPHLLRGLVERGIGLATLDLQVGVDTFRPIGEEAVEDHVMHEEHYDIPEATARAVEEVHRRGRRVVAIGTTVVRALEAASHDGRVRPGAASTDLFIRPGYRFRAVDVLVTNFHVPRSTLIVLVAAFVGEEWRHVYQTALSRGYRFLSFGDAMLAERP
jgi:S-adenosylmethionine:tRNA ribosyltransferase-isomerase